MNTAAQKDYSVSWESRTDHLSVHVSGARTYAAVMALSREVFNAAQASHQSSVLVDVREFAGRLGVLDSYRLVTDAFEMLRGGGIRKAAVVDVPLSPVPEWFLETVARNRGFNFRVFASPEEALAWLGS